MIPGFALTATLLALYAYAAWNPISRPHLDRVSFRLLVYALAAHLIFCIAFSLGTVAGHLGSSQCTTVAFLIQTCLMFSAGMFFCVALNLPLVLVFKVKGRRMEKYYVLGTSAACIISYVSALASGHLGWDSDNMTCWYRNNDRMLEWVLGTQTVWLLLTSTGEVLSFLTILGYLVAYELETRRFRRNAARSSPGSGTFARTAASRTSAAGSTISMFRNIILRIGLYPLVSCFLNISTNVLDLHMVQDTQPTELNWRLTVTDLAIYSARPLIYGLLAATDPSFIRAIHALRQPPSASSVSVQERMSRCTSTGYMSTVIEMPDVELALATGGKHPHQHPYPYSYSETQSVPERTPPAWLREEPSQNGETRSGHRHPNTHDAAPERLGAGQVPRTAENDVVCQI
ncbi:hypothetical protein GGX14DRAFT_85247 [Mycena pura]|uniref:G-protein coupled receptors family 2 profile 2 domain-containing protein n=1 Tax=Mycena pura TaxID=153505 RepID=A0AAD6YD34_9AGAR|nr:hypothetical protein GGX14DRAFT_85247 [Mycena pura]